MRSTLAASKEPSPFGSSFNAADADRSTVALGPAAASFAGAPVFLSPPAGGV